MEVLYVSCFDPVETKDDNCELEVHVEKPVYAPNDELKATIRLNVLSTMVNIRAISWQFFGAEMLERSGGYLSRHIVANHTEFLVGSEETNQDKTGPDVADKTHILETGPYEWEVYFTIPAKIPPTFRTDSARIEYYFAVVITRKLQNAVEYKTLIPIGCDFGEDCDRDEIVEESQSGIVPATGIFSRFFSAPENKITMQLDTNRFQYCPFGMENPCVNVHLTLSSSCSEIFTELSCSLLRKTILHHKDQDINESVVVCEPKVPLIPPLQPGATEEYYIQIPVCSTGKFVNPSRFSARCIFNEYFVGLDVRGITMKFCICISTYNPNPYVPPLEVSSASPVERADNQRKEREEEENKRKRAEMRKEVEQWDVERVVQWLEENQLSKLSESFREQSIDGAALLNLEEKYFVSLGVTLIGDKIKLEKALKDFQ